MEIAFSEKISPQLSAALLSTPYELGKEGGLSSGYLPESDSWEVIVKYVGDIENIKEKFGLNVIVAINKFNIDTEEEINSIKEKLAEKDVELSLVETFAKGGEGATDIAEKIVALSEKENQFRYIYNLNDDIKTKISKITTKIYGASGVEFTDIALQNIEQIEKLGYKELPVCIAKTQYSFSDDSKNLECKEPFTITIRYVELKAGAGFVVAFAGKIMTMPGLPEVPAAENIDIDNNGNISGIF